jgi:hypothetical protein
LASDRGRPVDRDRAVLAGVAVATTIDTHGICARLLSRPPATVANQNDAPTIVNATGRTTE